MSTKVIPEFKYSSEFNFTQNNKTESKIKEFGEYKPGWCYGYGEIFSSEVIETAIRINKTAAQNLFFNSDVFPGESGEILITLYRKPYYLDITIYSNNSFDVVTEFHDIEVERNENINFIEVNKLLLKFRKLTSCKLLDSSTPSTLTDKKNVLSVYRSRTRAAGVVSPLSKKIVSTQKVKHFANTLASSIQPLPDTLSSFGHSRRQSYLMAIS